MKHIWENLDWTLDICRFETLGPEWRTENFAKSWRIVPFSRIYLPLSGDAYIEHGGTEYHLRPGSLFLVPPFVSTRSWCPERLDMYWANFNAFVADSALDIFSVVRTRYELPVGDEEMCRKLFEKIVPHYRMGIRSGMKPAAAGEFISRAALMLLIQPFLESAEQDDGQSFERQSRFFGLLQYIEQNLAHDFTLKELAGKFHLNPTYLTNLFAEGMGISLMRYCHIRKLNRALTLLSTTELPISEIAYSLGMEDVNNFSRLFKRYYGVSPRNLRLHHDSEKLIEYTRRKYEATQQKKK